MQPTEGFIEEYPSSHSLNSYSRVTGGQEDDLQHFKQQVEDNYRRSVANHIYSFPLQLEYCASFVSSDDSSLEGLQQYDLNQQNRKHSDLEKQLQGKLLEHEKNKLQISHKKQRKKFHIRNQSGLVKKKYQKIVNFLNQSMSPKKPNSTIKGSARRQIIKFIDQKEKEKKQKIKRLQTFQFKQDKLRSKSHRLKTQPDQSIKTTFRKPVSQFRFANIKYPKNQ